MINGIRHRHIDDVDAGELRIRQQQLAAGDARLAQGAGGDTAEEWVIHLRIEARAQRQILRIEGVDLAVAIAQMDAAAAGVADIGEDAAV